MASIPVYPHSKRYRGSKDNVRRKAAEFSATAQRIADHVNELLANNPNDTQVYMFYQIAHALSVSVDDVRDAISDGGYNGITFGGVNAPENRRALEQYKAK